MTDPKNDFIRENYTTMTDKEMAESIGISTKAVKNRRQRMNLFKANGLNYDQETTDALIADLGEALQDIGKVEKITVNKRTVQTKKGDNPPDINDTVTTAVTLTPKFNDPEWPLVTEAKPIIVRPVKTAKKERTLKIAVLLPDPQIAYRYDNVNNVLDPFHDLAAIDVALKITKDLNPDKVINLGDYLDFPEFGKYLQEPAFAMTTQHSIDYGHEFLGRQIACAPNAEIIVLEGNHDKRLSTFIMANARAAFGITRAKDPKGWPVMSVPHLLRFEELGISYIDGYPAAEYYINDFVKVIHGRRTGQRGKISMKVLEDERISTITGHNHGIEVVYQTLHSRKGPVTAYAASLGTLARIDGAVPSYNNGTTVKGHVVQRYENWQQGMGVVYYDDNSDNHTLVPVQIHNGRAVFNGKVYEADLE